MTIISLTFANLSFLLFKYFVFFSFWIPFKVVRCIRKNRNIRWLSTFQNATTHQQKFSMLSMVRLHFMYGCVAVYHLVYLLIVSNCVMEFVLPFFLHLDNFFLFYYSFGAKLNSCFLFAIKYNWQRCILCCTVHGMALMEFSTVFAILVLLNFLNYRKQTEKSVNKKTEKNQKTYISWLELIIVTHCSASKIKLKAFFIWNE